MLADMSHCFSIISLELDLHSSIYLCIQLLLQFLVYKHGLFSQSCNFLKLNYLKVIPANRNHLLGNYCLGFIDFLGVISPNHE